MRALLIGGPNDGEQHEVDERHDRLTVPRLPSPDEWRRAFTGDAPSPARVVTAEYRLDTRIIPRRLGTHVVFRYEGDR